MYQHPQFSNEPLWIYPKQNLPWKEAIIKEFKIHPVIAQVLVSRGFTSLEEIHKYLYAKLPDLYDPFLMPEMQAAVDRVSKALTLGENILIYGDNDVDGMTGTALLTQFFQDLGANVLFYVSDRGIHRDRLIIEALEYAIQNECRLLITVDCGITAATSIAKFVEHNIDVIITDHHEPTDKIPLCVATLNPKLFNNPYPNRELTGVGVAFKLAHGIMNQLVSEGKPMVKKVDLKRYLDLVALGTVADMGSLMGENRILVRYGLRQLRKTKRLGLIKLLSVCDVDVNDISIFTIASKIAPRLNSIGRINEPRKGVELLLARHVSAAEQLAIELDLNNIERQRIERTMSLDLDNLIMAQPELLHEKGIVLYSDKWHPGIIAILSARFAKNYNRPTAMISVDSGIGKASLRSIPEFPLLPALRECADLLINFGGHDFAAGLTLKEQNIEAFKQRFIGIANAHLSDSDVCPKLWLDAEVKFEELTFDFMESLRLLEPYGHENPQPLLYSDAKQAWPPKPVGKAHLKLYLEQGDRILEGLALGQARQSPALRKRDLVLRVAFTPQLDHVPESSLQLLIRHFIILS